MSEVRPDIARFFRCYDEAGSRLDVDALRELFAETFLNVDPNAARIIERELMLAALPRRKAMFEAAGATGLELCSVAETPLDPLHTLARVTWRVRIREQAGLATPVDVRSTFLLRQTAQGWQVVMSLYHDDIGAVLASLS